MKCGDHDCKTALTTSAVFLFQRRHEPGRARDRQDTARQNSTDQIGSLHDLGYNSIRASDCKRAGFMMKIIYPLIGCVAVALTVGASAARAEDDFWLSGNYTQNVPCKGDGSDPAEVKVQISAQEIDSKVGVCTFLDTKLDGKSVKAHVECKFPAGPLMGDITFTQKPNNTVTFVDSNKTYTATLYRCPK